MGGEDAIKACIIRLIDRIKDLTQARFPFGKSGVTDPFRERCRRGEKIRPAGRAREKTSLTATTMPASQNLPFMKRTLAKNTAKRGGAIRDASRFAGEFREQQWQLVYLRPTRSRLDRRDTQCLEELVQSGGPFLCQWRRAIVFLLPCGITIFPKPRLPQRMSKRFAERP